jgi:hypothetical protein
VRNIGAFADSPIERGDAGMPCGSGCVPASGQPSQLLALSGSKPIHGTARGLTTVQHCGLIEGLRVMTVLRRLLQLFRPRDAERSCSCRATVSCEPVGTPLLTTILAISDDDNCMHRDWQSRYHYCTSNSKPQIVCQSFVRQRWVNEAGSRP